MGSWSLLCGLLAETIIMKYSIIIPTYNHCDDLLKPCVDSILQYSRMTDVELIISANGCVDNTRTYLEDLKSKFEQIGMADHFKYVWSDAPLGYSKANNVAISQATSDLIVLLNNDVMLLPQSRQFWLDALHAPFLKDPQTGMSCVVKSWSDPAAHMFAIFFCVMIHRRVFDKIGVLNEAYGTGGGEDVEFSIECERAGFRVTPCILPEWSSTSHMFTSGFPVYHKGEGTMHDVNLVSDWKKQLDANSRMLAHKYNPSWLQQPHVSMFCQNTTQVAEQFVWLAQTRPEAAEIFQEVITQNCYRVTPDHVRGHSVIDVGANLGTFSIMCAALGAPQVIACEPVSHTFEYLNSHVQRAGFGNVIHTVKAAITHDDSQVVSMGVGTDSGKSSLYDAGGTREWVPTHSLQHVVSQCVHDRITLKLDCEGAEYDILLDSEPHVFDRIQHIMLETHGDLHPVHKGIHLLHRRLQELGFKPVHQEPYGVWWYNSAGERVKWEPLNMSVETWSKS
jgi:FkbM family methyltransferase